MSTNKFKMVNGVTIKLSEEENNTLDAKEAAAVAALSERAWFDGRMSEYPSIPEQLDNIYHNGIDIWKADIAAIKLRHPKP